MRDRLGLTQREMAGELNVAHGAVAAWEAGSRTMPGPVLRLLDMYEAELGIAPSDGGLDSLETSVFRRSLALSTSAVTGLGEWVRTEVEGMLMRDPRAGVLTARAQIGIARHLARTLGDLKGPAMKLGQMLAYVDYALPPDVRAELGCLLTAGAPMSADVVSRVVAEELGKPPEKLFRSWSRVPFAAASVGQVHRAELPSGEEVAVKVQYPDIAAAIDADLRAGAMLERLSRVVFRGVDYRTWIEELRDRFSEECDYRIEAENQQHYRRIWQGRRGFRIPRVHESLTTRRVLVTELVRADDFETFARTSSAEQRRRAGEAIRRFTFESIFRHGVFHADPHPGNYLFSEGDVVFLDFGCVKRFEEPFVDRWQAWLRAVIERDFDKACDLWVQMGMVRQLESFDFAYQARAMIVVCEPFLQGGLFKFTPEVIAETWRALYVDSPNRSKMQVPGDWVLSTRLQWGVNAVLARLGAEGDYRTQMLELLYPPGSTLPTPYTCDEIALAKGLVLPKRLAHSVSN